MPRLYKFECLPNNPVVNTAVLVFWIPDNSVQDVNHLARKLGELEGFEHVAHEAAKLTYLGTYEPTPYQINTGNNVLVAISGEY